MKGARLAAIAALAVACGDIATSPDASVARDASDDATLDAAPLFDAAAPFDGGTVVDPGFDASVVDGGGWFVCGDCPCDGRTHYCDIGYGPGGAPLSADAGDPDACTGFSSCTPLPDGCAPARCSCLVPPIVGECACYHADSGDGLMAGCFYP